MKSQIPAWTRNESSQLQAISYVYCCVVPQNSALRSEVIEKVQKTLESTLDKTVGRLEGELDALRENAKNCHHYQGELTPFDAETVKDSPRMEKLKKKREKLKKHQNYTVRDDIVWIYSVQ